MRILVLRHDIGHVVHLHEFPIDSLLKPVQGHVEPPLECFTRDFSCQPQQAPTSEVVNDKARMQVVWSQANTG